MFELMDSYSQSAVIKVIGVGGGGGNAVEYMVSANIDGVDFICANTDAQALKNSTARTTLQLGCNITKGLGAGANPEIGRQSALEDRERIIEVLEGADMVFITAGMGGGPVRVVCLWLPRSPGSWVFSLWLWSPSPFLLRAGNVIRLRMTVSKHSANMWIR